MTAAPRREQPALGMTSFPALGSTATLLMTGDDPAMLTLARLVLEDELATVDAACSRFRPDSELAAVNRAAGRPVVVSELLAEAIMTALRAAELTDGAVDPTVGAQLRALGYDKTFTELTPRAQRPGLVPAPGWRDIAFDPGTRKLHTSAGTSLDLGASAKALAADRAAARCSRATDRGVLVNLGGDIRVAGSPPDGGWRVGISDDHRQQGAPQATITLAGGALATSGTAVRTWRCGTRTVHHIVDPRTGDNPPPGWRTVSVTAATCVDANTAATAAIVLGSVAPQWLHARGLPARLVGVDGAVTCVAGWPAQGAA
jgi:thiamine biosynthesis lipoprotein